MGRVIAMYPDNQTDEDQRNLALCLECGRPVTTDERSVPSDWRNPDASLVHIECYAQRLRIQVAA